MRNGKRQSEGDWKWTAEKLGRGNGVMNREEKRVKKQKMAKDIKRATDNYHFLRACADASEERAAQM